MNTVNNPAGRPSLRFDCAEQTPRMRDMPSEMQADIALDANIPATCDEMG